MKILSGKTAAFFRFCTFSLSLFFLLAPSLISANVLVDTLKPSASNTGSIFLGTAKDFLPQVVDPTVLLITTPFRNITSVVKGESNLASISSVWNSFLDIFRTEDEVAPTNTTTIIRNTQPGTNTIVRETTVTGDTSFIERQIATLTARVNSLGGNTTPPVVNNNTYVTYSSSPSSGGGGISIGDGSFSGLTAGLSNQISLVRSDLTSSIAGIDLTNLSDVTVNGGITLNDITPPATTTDLLYNDLGDLYWAGNLIAGGAVGTWTSNGTDVYRTSGNVGVGTTTPSQLLTIGDNAFITSSGDALFAGTTTMSLIDAYGGGGLSIDVVNRILYANDGTTPQLDWSSAGTFNLSNGTSLSTAGGDLFFNAAGGHSVVSNSPFNAYQGIVDGSNIVSINSNARTLNDTSGNAVVSWGDGTYALNATGNSNFTGDIYGGGYGYFSSGLFVNELSPYDNSAYFEVNGKGGFNDGVSSVYFVDATYAVNATGNSYFNGDMGVGMTPVSARLSVNYNNVYVRLGDGTNIAGVFEDGTNTVNIADGTNAINATGPIKSLTAGGNVFGAFGESGYGVAGTRAIGGGVAAAYFDDGGASSIVTIADGTYAINATGNSLFTGTTTVSTLVINNMPLQANIATSSFFVGTDAGSGATDAIESNFFGVSAGQDATDAYNSNFLGSYAGYGATGANGSNFLGAVAGNNASNAYYSNFLGYYAGNGATNAHDSNFFGDSAGYNAANAANSIFIGKGAGLSDTVDNTTGGKSSILIGNYTSTGGFSNSIAIGKGTANNAVDQLNIGRVIYATGISSSSSPSATPTSGGRVGVGTTTPSAKLAITGTAGTSDIFAIASSTEARLLTFTSTGRLGIAQSAPTGLLEVKGSSGSMIVGTGGETLTFTRTATNYIYASSAGGSLAFGSNGSTADMNLASGKLTLGNGNNALASTFNVKGSDSTSANSSLNIVNLADTPLLFVRNDGTVGIGTTTPGQKLTVVGNIDIGTTTSSTGGQLTQNGTRLLHNYGTDNLFFGLGAGNFTTTGNYNGGFGTDVLKSVTSSSESYGFGYRALYSLQSGSANVAVGAQALYAVVSGTRNTAIGRAAGYGITSSDNIAIGYNSFTNSSGGFGGNIGIGRETFFNGANNLLNNTIVGNYAVYAPDGARYNTGVGSGNLYALTTGWHNTVFGNSAGDNITTGSNNIIIGSLIDAPSATGSNQLSIGNLIFGTGLDGTGTTTSTGNIGIGTSTPSAQLTTTGTVRFAGITGGTLTADSLGNVTASSDENLKDITGEFTRGLEDIQKINPISYHWKESTGYDTANLYSGFSAQNIQLAIPEAVLTNTSGFLTLQDRPILAAAINAIKELGSVFSKIEDGIAYMRSVVVETLTVDELKVESGVTIKDRVNGNYYCLVMEAGVMRTYPGSCDQQTSLPSVVTTPAVQDPIVVEEEETVSTSTPSEEIPLELEPEVVIEEPAPEPTTEVVPPPQPEVIVDLPVSEPAAE